ncbi:MAG: homocysteine S-methyltransferase family protein [Sedimentisphaerales bacterium]|nr:homocysteine S-methyltransferase family protein [Sedimentisphaerales bacterium]
MSKKTLIERIKEGVLLLDGAMGTQLTARGARTDTCSNYMNIEQPELVAQVHQAYWDAGSDAIITNTFGANKYQLARHGIADKVAQIGLAGAQIARKSATEDRYVLGDIGPCGDFLEPLGLVKADELEAAFVEQANILAQGGVDGFIIETMTAIEEVKVTIKAIRSISNLPILVSLAFDAAGSEFKTMMGVDVARAVNELAELEISAIGYNCGTLTMDQYVSITRIFAEQLDGTGLSLIAQPNAGKPELVEDKAVYSLSPEDFAEKLEDIYKAGASIIGGCCGTTPEHIKAAADRIKG